MFEKIINDEKANLMAIGTELTGFLVLIGLVALPVGYASLASINKTAIGITVGSQQDTILTAIGTIFLAVLVMAMIAMLAKGGRQKTR